MRVRCKKIYTKPNSPSFPLNTLNKRIFQSKYFYVSKFRIVFRAISIFKIRSSQDSFDTWHSRHMILSWRSCKPSICPFKVRQVNGTVRTMKAPCTLSTFRWIEISKPFMKSISYKEQVIGHTMAVLHHQLTSKSIWNVDFFSAKSCQEIFQYQWSTIEIDIWIRASLPFMTNGIYRYRNYNSAV